MLLYISHPFWFNNLHFYSRETEFYSPLPDSFSAGPPLPRGAGLHRHCACAVGGGGLVFLADEDEAYLADLNRGSFDKLRKMKVFKQNNRLFCTKL